jgi:NADH/NAD ratio-sensing transcriptional regulator Rex
MIKKRENQPLIPTAYIARVYSVVKEMKAKDPKRWLSAPEIAELASVNVETVRRHVRLLSKAKVFEKAEFVQFLYRLADDAHTIIYTRELEEANSVLNRYYSS